MKNKKKKGFTLIELLAIIVILAIIAVITVPIILNVIDNAKKGAAKDSAYGYKDAVNKYYVSELYENLGFNLDGSYTITDKGRLSNETGVHEIPFTGTTPTGGYLTYENNILTSGCIAMDEYKVTIENGEVTTVEKGNCGEISTPKAIAIISQEETGKLLSGDEVRIGETEHFYVVSSNENETVLLSKYNLNVGNNTQPEEYGKLGMQNSKAIGWDGKDVNTLRSSPANSLFSSSIYWHDASTSNLKSHYGTSYNDSNNSIYDVSYNGAPGTNNYSVAYYVETYADELEKFEVIVRNSRLLTLGEAYDLGCEQNSCTNVLEKNEFVYSTSYWLGSASSGYGVKLIFADGRVNQEYPTSWDIWPNALGVRPVIVVNTSDIL